MWALKRGCYPLWQNIPYWLQRNLAVTYFVNIIFSFPCIDFHISLYIYFIIPEQLSIHISLYIFHHTRATQYQHNRDSRNSITWLRTRWFSTFSNSWWMIPVSIEFVIQINGTTPYRCDEQKSSNCMSQRRYVLSAYRGINLHLTVSWPKQSNIEVWWGYHSLEII